MHDSTIEVGPMVTIDGGHDSTVDHPMWRMRSFRGGVMTDEDLAAMSGPKITMIVGAAVVLLGLSVIWKGDPSQTAAGFWPPAGASFVAMAILPMRRWGWVAAAILMPPAIGVALGVVPLAAGSWWGLANCVEPAVAALAVRRFIGSRWLTPSRLMLVFLVSAVVVAPIIGGAIGTIGTVAGYGGQWPDVWAEWALGDGLGVLVVVPLLMTYTTRGLFRRTRGELFGLVALVVVATGLAFAHIGPNGAALLPYLILVALIWAGMRFGTRAAAVAGFVVAVGANLATSQGFGPFAAESGAADAVTLQIFLAIALVTSFAVSAMASGLADRDEVHRLLTQQATHDALTGLPNRLLFGQRLHKALQSRHHPSGGAVALLIIDLDDFKKINDRHGHPTGDEALVVIAQLLRRVARPEDLVARLGGDEFAVLCRNLTGPGQAAAIAAGLTRALDHPIDVGSMQYRLTGSIGIALMEGDEHVTGTDLLRRADIALHRSKRTEGVRISLFDERLEAQTRRRVEMDEELRGAIERGELFVQYQPIVCLATGRVSKFEALARWHSRRFGVVAPDEFIALAEQIGLINTIGDWVLEQACRQTAEWRSQVDEPSHATATIAVNVSARQLGDSAFPGRVRRILDDVELPPSSLTLEITETAVMDDLDASEKVIAELRQIGVNLSMDDFGTGYSSMTYLRRMPVDTLKIDRSFVAGLGDLREDTAIVESIVNLGHSFGIEVVAEGIETLWQLQHLVRLGCDHGQGFLWSKAVDAAAAEALLRDTFYIPAPDEPAVETPSAGDVVAARS